jgi:hypothetical protein
LPTPAWLGATAGYAAYAGQINQFLGAHEVSYLYQGAVQASSTAVTGSGSVSQSQWLAQKFTAGASQTVTGHLLLYAYLVTGSPPPWVISLQADSGSGAPSGTVLASTTLPKEMVPGAAGWVPVMLPLSGLTPSGAYWIVAAEAGDSGDYFAWMRTTAGSGASTSANGTTWTAQAYGFGYQVLDQSPVLPLAGTWEDSGARWTSLGYDAGGQLTTVGEYTAGQSAAGYTASFRTLTWTGGLLTGAA